MLEKRKLITKKVPFKRKEPFFAFKRVILGK